MIKSTKGLKDWYFSEDKLYKLFEVRISLQKSHSKNNVKSYSKDVKILPLFFKILIRTNSKFF